jgi:replicative DNA helicase
MLVMGRPFQYGLLSDHDYKIIERAANQLTGDKIYINDSPAQSVGELCLRARKMVQAGAKFLIVDYLQLLGGPTGESRYQIVSEISRRLKMLAGQLSVPILCLSQLSRKVEERSGGRPQLSDLRESGSIEQDADVVMFITRDETMWSNRFDRGDTELLIAKNRSGAVGDIRLRFEKEIMKFTSE